MSEKRDPSGGCFLCRAAEDPDDPENLVVHAGCHQLVLLNRYPYTNGHLMVAPREHVADPAESPREAWTELWAEVLVATRVLGAAYRPDGLNLGMNLGSAAGAGVPEHYHFHVVPRWSGDTSFTTVVGGIRLVPEELHSVWRKLRDQWPKRESEG